MAGIEIERKYVIAMPRVSDMRALNKYSSSEITQTYLSSLPGITHRVRRRVYDDGRVEYTETVKKRISLTSSYEDERHIDREEYESLAAKIMPFTRQLKKVRHTFEYGGQLFEIDVYPEWENSCIMETELASEGMRVEFPDFIEVIEDVTGKFEYSNASMSRSFPPELK